MDEHIYPAEAAWWAEIEANTAAGRRWTPLEVIEASSPGARGGLWNLFLPPSADGRRATTGGPVEPEYAPLAEIMGRVPWAARSSTARRRTPATWKRSSATAAPNRSAGRAAAGRRIRSAFAMTEPAVASSDATNIAARIERQGDEYVINGRKVVDLRRRRSALQDLHLHGQDRSGRAKHAAAVDVLVPAETPGSRLRPLSVFGYDDAPHGHMEVDFENVRVPVSTSCSARPRLRDRAGRLGPRRIHHCMRLIGLASGRSS